MANKELLNELGFIAIFIAMWFFFVATNVNPQLGTIYNGLVVIGVIIALIDYQFGKRDVKLVNPNHSWITALVSALVAYVVLIGIQQWVVPIVSKGVPVSDLLKLIAASTPVFAKSAIINFITFAGPIAFIETYTLFVVGFDLLASMFGVEISRKNLTNPKLWLIIFGLSLLFLLLHVTARGIEDNAALLLVFFMAVISCLLVVIYKEGRTAILFHILPNSIGMLSYLGIKIF